MLSQKRLVWDSDREVTYELLALVTVSGKNLPTNHLLLSILGEKRGYLTQQ